MYLPRSLLTHLYLNLLRSHHPLSPPVLILAALEPDALCACRIFTTLLKRDYIPHKIQPIGGYTDLIRAGSEMIQPLHASKNGGAGGVVVCIGVGGLVDLTEILGFENEDGSVDMGGVEIWLIDSRRPFNLGNVFGGGPSKSGGGGGALQDSSVGGLEIVRGVDRGRVTQSYKPGSSGGGVFVFDDGDIEDEMTAERDAFFALEEMPELDDESDDETDDNDDDGDNGNNKGSKETADSDEDVLQQPHVSKKRKSWSREGDAGDDEEDDFVNEFAPPSQRRRDNSSSLVSSTHRLQMTSSDETRPGSPGSNSPSPDSRPHTPSPHALRRKLRRLRQKHENVLRDYYSLGSFYSEPISSLIYSIASELGREDNDMLWLAIVGISSLELSGRSMSGVGVSDASDAGGSAGWGGSRGENIRRVFRDEVRRLNPPNPNDVNGYREGIREVIPTTGRSPNDTAILLSPEPRFLLIRHWSLYDSMLHSPYLAARLHVWNESGRKRLHKLLAKMGVSLSQCHQNYTHMDIELKRVLRRKLLAYAPMYGLDGLVPPSTSSAQSGWGFVRTWGWKACLSALDVGVILGAILDVGSLEQQSSLPERKFDGNDEDMSSDSAQTISRFWKAYDAVTLTASESPSKLLASLPLAQHLHRAILRTGTTLLSKHLVRHLRSFRIAVIKDGPDVKLFTNPGALTKLALWLAEAVKVQEQERGERGVKTATGKRSATTPLVLAGLDEDRNVYVVVGTGGGGGVIDFSAIQRRNEKQKKRQEAKEKKASEKAVRRARRVAENAERREAGDFDGVEEDENEEDDDDDDDDDDDEDSSDSDSDSDVDDGGRGWSRSIVRNRFGIAFHEVVQETNARVRVDSFEHSVVEVQKEDLGAFLEALGFRSVVA